MGLIEHHAKNLIRRNVKQPARRAMRRAVERWCPECQKNVPLFHTCCYPPLMARAGPPLAVSGAGYE